jgi:hypothetical protein
VKGNNTYQIVYAGNSDLAMDGAWAVVISTVNSEDRKRVLIGRLHNIKINYKT